MSDLWSPSREKARAAAEPLAVRMRPRTLAEFAGQHHLLGSTGATARAAQAQSAVAAAPQRPLLRRMIDAATMTSIILHGPPGTGKTTLARLIAQETKRHFVRENAANVSVKHIREIIDDAARRIESGGVTAQSYMGVEKSYYRPKEVGWEQSLKERLAEVKRARSRDDS